MNQKIDIDHKKKGDGVVLATRGGGMSFSILYTVLVSKSKSCIADPNENTAKKA